MPAASVRLRPASVLSPSKADLLSPSSPSSPPSLEGETEGDRSGRGAAMGKAATRYTVIHMEWDSAGHEGWAAVEMEKPGLLPVTFFNIGLARQDGGGLQIGWSAPVPCAMAAALAAADDGRNWYA